VLKTARVNRRAAARWQSGHPWIFRSDVMELPNASAGPVRVVSEDRRFLGMALWSPLSQISLRMLTAADQPIDGRFWEDRIARARAFRTTLRIEASAYRVIHGEADGLPSLIADRYQDVIVVQLLSAGLEACRQDIVAALLAVLEPAGVLARNDVGVRRAEGLAENVELVHGHVPDELEVREGRIAYLVAPWTGQKTGAFLDQRENRFRVGELARGRALDCFAYHGSFSLHLAPGATEVVALDSSAPALLRAQTNAALNGFSNVKTVEANVFDFLREQQSAGTQYDTIVLDPPAFAKRRDTLDKALGAYKEINLRAMKLLADGGHLATFSCSHHVDAALFREMLESAARDACRPIRWIEARGQALDHPEIISIPETAYLKGAILQAV
jgi:23S rRNA (cytosine1962-C5)-methyltransferase